MVKGNHDGTCKCDQNTLLAHHFENFVRCLHALRTHTFNPSHNRHVVLKKNGLAVIDFMLRNDHSSRIPIPFLPNDFLEKLYPTLLEIIQVSSVINYARSIDVHKPNFGLVYVRFWQMVYFHAIKVHGSYLRGMIELDQLYKIIWSLLLLASSIQFGMDTASVTHFSAMIASALPLVGVLGSERKKLDQGFLSILMMTICSVAAAIALAQWKVLGNGAPHDVIIPVVSGIVWILHAQRKKNHQSKS